MSAAAGTRLVASRMLLSDVVEFLGVHVNDRRWPWGASCESFPGPTPLTGWAIVMLSSAVVVLNLIMEFSDLHLLPGGHSQMWLAAGVIGLLGGAMLIGSKNP